MERKLSFEERFGLLRETRRKQRARHKQLSYPMLNQNAQVSQGDDNHKLAMMINLKPAEVLEEEEECISAQQQVARQLARSCKKMQTNELFLCPQQKSNSTQATSDLMQKQARQDCSFGSIRRHNKRRTRRRHLTIETTGDRSAVRLMSSFGCCLIWAIALLATLANCTTSQSAESTNASMQQQSSAILQSNEAIGGKLAATSDSLPRPIAMAVSAPGTSALQSGATSGEQQQQLQPKAAELVRGLGHAQEKQPNVIVIKYANVSNVDNNDNAPNEQLKVFELVNEPLSVQLIEQRFSQSIQLFDVSQNQLSTLSKDLFCPLSNEVRQLNASRNLLENFDCLGLISQAGQLCLSELRTLDMSFNLIRHLPATGVATLHNLEQLDLSHNQIESLDELALSSLFKLIHLDLSFNRLKQLPQRLFHKSSSMRSLILASNQLQINLTQQLLTGLISLEELNLSRNNITYIGEHALVDKTNLTRVDLTFNQLASLRQESTKITPLLVHRSLGASSMAQQQRQRLYHNGQYAIVSSSSSSPMAQRWAEIYLYGNPFVCDCQLEWMRRTSHRMMSSSTSQHQQRQRSASLSSANRWQHHTFAPNQLDQFASSQPTDLQNDQPTVISTAATTGEDTSSMQFARLADFNLLRCAPLHSRRHSTATSSQTKQQPNLPVQKQLRTSTSPSGGQDGNYNALPATTTTTSQQTVDIATADSSNFLCPYKSHCFALCHCCEFDACDCEMICPNRCQCYYDSSWHTNVIDCSSSNHTHVPERIPMDSTELRLDGNNITSLRPSNLIARKALKALYLNSTNLHHIANRTFNGLIELQVLYLNDNQLRQLNGHEFEPLAQLRQLYLQSNRLDSIANNTFIYLRSLELLDLSNNRLVSSAASFDLFWSIARHNIRLRQVSLAHNWWSCQCQTLLMLRQLLTQKFVLAGGVSVSDRNQLRCYYNATTVGPLILAADSSSSSSPPPTTPTASAAANWQVPPISGSISSQLPVASNGQRLTEINECSDEAELRAFDFNELSPPIFARDYATAQQSHSSSSQAQQNQIQAQSNDPMSHFGDPAYDFGGARPNGFGGQLQMQNSAQQTPAQYMDQPYASSDEPQQQQRATSNTNQAHLPFQQMPPGVTGSGGGGGAHATTSGRPLMLATSLTGALVALVLVGAFLLLVRLQQHRSSSRQGVGGGGKRRASAAAAAAAADHFRRQAAKGSMSIGSSSADFRSSATPPTTSLIVSGGGGGSGKRPPVASARHLPSPTTHPLFSSSPANEAMLSARQSQVAMGANRTLIGHNHTHSGSSQSNIYAALVSPNAPNSSVVATAAPPLPHPPPPSNPYADSSATQRHWQQQQHQPIYGAPSSLYAAAAAHKSSAAGSVYGLSASAVAADYESPGSLVGVHSVIGPAKSMVARLLSGSLALGSRALKAATTRRARGDRCATHHHHHPHHRHACAAAAACAAQAMDSAAAAASDSTTTSTSAYANSLASDKIYDIFLSYDKRDEQFVLNHLSAELEYGQPQYR